MRKAQLKVWKLLSVWMVLVLMVSLGVGLVPARPVAAQNYPLVVSVNGGNNNTDSTSHTVNLPGSIVAGNLLLVFFSVDGNPTITFPAGWTQLFNTARTEGGTTYVRFGCWYRIATGTEGATITVNTSGPSGSQRSAHTSYQISNYTGVPVSATATNNNQYPDPPILTPAWEAADTLWFATCGYDQGQRTVTGWPANYTMNQRNERSNDANGVGVGTAGRQYNAASENPGTFTISASQRWVAATVAIRPVAPPTVATTAASPVGVTTATLNGNITATGGVTPNYRGFVWGTTSIPTNPGNVAPPPATATTGLKAAPSAQVHSTIRFQASSATLLTISGPALIIASDGHMETSSVSLPAPVMPSIPSWL